MKILFHVAVGNTDRPRRWNFVNGLFSDLATSLEALGNECLMYIHPEACSRATPFKNSVISEKVGVLNFNPDCVFTWNGSSDGDIQIIEKYGKKKIIYGELGVYDHYSSVIFDFTGTNSKMEILTTPPINSVSKDIRVEFGKMAATHGLPRLFLDPYVFVVLQDELDTNITLYSPFKKMDDLLDYVETLYAKTDIKILFKKHPKAKTTVKSRDNFIEVFDDVHHYLPYASQVIGINSTALVETFLYHDRVLSVGLGLSSKRFSSLEERMNFMVSLKNQQFKWEDLKNKSVVENSYLYKKMKTLWEQ